MITSASTTDEMLDALYRASGDLLAALDPKACFLTTHAMTAASDVRRMRKIISHARRQKESGGEDDPDRDRPVE